MSLKIPTLAALLTLSGPALALDSSAGPLTVTKLADGFSQPWAVEALPDGGKLVTERGGALIHAQGRAQSGG